MGSSVLSRGPLCHDPWAGCVSSSSRRVRRATEAGFTAVEILIVVAIITTLIAVAVPIYMTDLDQARVSRAATEIRTLEDAITLYEGNNGALPTDLAQAGYPNFLDPWGKPYAYLNHTTMSGNGVVRQDRFLVNLNSDYDLYSTGKDGQTAQPVTSATSLDDVIRASNGAYLGPAANF